MKVEDTLMGGMGVAPEEFRVVKDKVEKLEVVVMRLAEEVGEMEEKMRKLVEMKVGAGRVGRPKGVVGGK